MSHAEQAASARSIRAGWWLSTPALLLLTIAAVGPLLIVLIYSFLTPGKYGNVEWIFSWQGWVSVLFERDVFDDTLRLADANLTIFFRSVKLSFITTVLTFLVGFPTAWFIATRPTATPSG